MQSLPTRICTDAIPHDSATKQTRLRLHATNWRQPRISGCGWRCCGKKSKGSSQRRKNSSGSWFGDIKGRQGQAGFYRRQLHDLNLAREPPAPAMLSWALPTSHMQDGSLARNEKISRRPFVKQVTAAGGVRDPRVEAAFAAVAREDFCFRAARYPSGNSIMPPLLRIGSAIKAARLPVLCRSRSLSG